MRIHELRDRLKAKFPQARLELDEPSSPKGSTFLNVEYDGQAIAVEWRSDFGFGLSSHDPDSYGDGHDEVVGSVDAAFARIVQLLETRTRTKPPGCVRLRELRASRGMTQAEVAKLMELQQNHISRIESGRDLHLSTLRSLVAAMGGELVVLAHFADGDKRLDLDELAPSK
jgi:DNA-binding XRE family transcriptional regulator